MRNYFKVMRILKIIFVNHNGIAQLIIINLTNICCKNSNFCVYYVYNKIHMFICICLFILKVEVEESIVNSPRITHD
jgi:hypothetical protein